MAYRRAPRKSLENHRGLTLRFLLLILFAGSGFSALIYEIVWFQLLTLAIGSTAISLGILLAIFMGGLCAGSAGFSRLRLTYHPLRVYSTLECGIALFGLLVLWAIPLAGQAYFAAVPQGLAGMLLRGLLAAICMLPPTILMGASLPAIVRWLKATPAGIAWWGFLYGGNTAGAVLGCLFAGFYLLRIYNTATTTYVAAAINLLVAALSWMLASRTEPLPAPSDPLAAPAGDWPVYFTIALSGATALGAEIVWTRLLGMMLGATVYVFSIILAVFLTGLALGSAGGSWLVRRVQDARIALAASQLVLMLGIAWTAYMIAGSLPYWNAAPLLNGAPWLTFRLDLIRCFCAILPPTLLWGASFPLACAAVASPGEDPARVVGGIYAANTLGAIAGALGASLVLVPWIGTQQTERVLLALAAISAWVLLVPRLRTHRPWRFGAALVASVIVAVPLILRLPAISGGVIAYGRRMSTWNGTVLYTAEGINSSVAISRSSDGETEVDVNGHVEATTETYDMKLQRMVGHLPGVLHPNPRSVLGIGFGAGVSAGTFTRYPTIEHITICEIEPVIPPTSTRYFAREDYDVLHNPRTRMVYDDARHFVLTTPEKFDIIASDPLDVFVKGTAALYSLEYFEAVKRHLNPGGMFTLYVPLYETDAVTIRSELATFFAAFPEGTIWANTVGGQGYDMVFLGQSGPLQINLDEVQRRLERPDYAPVLDSLRGVGIGSAQDLFSTYSGRRSNLEPWLRGAPVSRDRDLRLQYIAGWGINSAMADELYRQILGYRRLPTDIFVGSQERRRSLYFALLPQTAGTN
ncbi:MAG: fused MFS/spermidine synthase [Acidobacteriia bacterium]|nr:fused MFS/spermidine synthase [Terriglobia bacterium]